MKQRHATKTGEGFADVRVIPARDRIARGNEVKLPQSTSSLGKYRHDLSSKGTQGKRDLNTDSAEKTARRQAEERYRHNVNEECLEE